MSYPSTLKRYEAEDAGLSGKAGMYMFTRDHQWKWKKAKYSSENQWLGNVTTALASGMCIKVFIHMTLITWSQTKRYVEQVIINSLP